MSFQNLGLCAPLLRAIEALGHTTPTPIQEKAIPRVLEGTDVLAGARTGTGKTAAFALPILQRLDQDKTKPQLPRALILTPTRELAAQVENDFKAYGRFLSLRTAVIFGGVNINPQIRQFQKGVDILVATPGRLLDHVGRKTLDLSCVKFLVLDEADRMLDMGFIHDIRKVIRCLPVKRQSMLFSATYTKEIRNLADGLLKTPAQIEVSPGNSAPQAIDQEVYQVTQDGKRGLLSGLIRDGNWHQTLVFTRTKHRANRLTKQLLSDGITAAAIHGNKSQATRTRALADFKSGAVQTLVATDIAARGLDIKHLPHVVNFDMPHVAEDYIHRIGRTGRAGEQGAALSLVSSDEQGLLANIQRLLKKQLPVKQAQASPVKKSSRPAAPAKPASGVTTPGPGSRKTRPTASPARPDTGRRPKNTSWLPSGLKPKRQAAAWSAV
ncbi:MAG: DEAD/DEAH box helicase [Desulfotignum sp.]|nr:DEAD/DEAH box helicase [Desulfotignum sp.]MCF8113970.1 DEAD/DEAH box helicase [Desulfotignum sp.]MCF8125025.1 DEAD/DEAH box helicase [Desulfotignum sp.]